MTIPVRTVLVAHPDAELGDLAAGLLHSVLALRAARCRVVVALPSAGPLVAGLRRTGAEVLIVPMVLLRRELRWSALVGGAPWGFVGAWRTVTRVRPDTVYVSTAAIPQWPLVARLRRIPTVSHLRAPQPTASRMVGRLTLRAHLASRHTLVGGGADLELLRDMLPALARRAEIVPAAVPSPPSPLPPREPLEGALRILYLGPITPRRGADLTIEAAALLCRGGRRAQVTLVGRIGTDQGWFAEQLRDQAAEAEVEVELLDAGAEAARERWDHLARADVLLVPTRHGEEDLAAVEGVLSLRPVIASDTAALREAVGEHRTARLVRPDDAAEIARALEHLLEHWPEIIAELPASRDRARRRHDPDRFHAAIARACGAPPS
ncbi:glycosyltransferase family 4 protein [Brachybacterium sp. YJGR34]|uniref:glycosyltransferase family 4 protein n=1 Tax=Brachybacterium sp. YJGR34 TaxID=2059911 RepID=UPI000E0C7577|nr:glycosyltransferase family 4 protein [Brachybacterium sp. YJGR34]